MGEDTPHPFFGKRQGCILQQSTVNHVNFNSSQVKARIYKRECEFHENLEMGKKDGRSEEKKKKRGKTVSVAKYCGKIEH